MSKLWHFLLQSIKSDTSKDSSVLLVGTVISTLLNIFLIVLLTHGLTVEGYGLFVTGLTFIQLLTDVSDIGINSAILKFLPASQGAEKERIIKTTLNLKVLLGGTLAVLIYVFSSPIANYFFKNNSIFLIIQGSSLGVLLLILIFWAQNIFIAEKKFFSSMVVNTSINVLRTGVILILLIAGIKSFNVYFWAAQIILIISIIYVFRKLGAKFIGEKISKVDYIRILKFGLPIGGGFALAAIYTKLDQILVLKIAGDYQAGIYGLALRLSTFFILISAAFSNAFTPRFSSMEGITFKKYFHKTLIFSEILSLLPLVSIPLASLLIPWIFPKFTPSISSFQILSVGMIFFILGSPFYSAIIYRLKKPTFSLVSGGMSLVLIYVLLSKLIPTSGSLGAAISVSVVYLLQTVSAIAYYLFQVNSI